MKLPVWWTGPTELPSAEEMERLRDVFAASSLVNPFVAWKGPARLSEIWQAAAIDIAVASRITGAEASYLFTVGFRESESPIEAMLWIGVMRAFLVGAAAPLTTSGLEFGEGVVHMKDLNGPDWLLSIHARPSREIGGHIYRPDILVVERGMTGTGRDDEQIEQVITVAVEADGHDFHERTKEQASRDRGRDRTFQLSGIPILRFTGSEIHRDAFGCGKQVETCVWTQGQMQRDQLWRANGIL